MEKYFVGSDGDAPQQIYFDRDTAFSSGDPFIDVFNEEGVRITAYKRVSDYDIGNHEYTEDF